MVTTLYYKIPKRLRLIIFFIIIVLIAYFVLRFLALTPKKVPDDFLKARQQASLIAQDIVSLSSDSANKLDEISQLDNEQKYTEALTLISNELDSNRQAREKAIELSVQLEQMTQNISQISPSSAGQIALEAISSETSLISRLINYYDYMYQLLEILREKFLGQTDGDQISDLINKINNEAQAINDLNQKFNDLMKQFDIK